MKQRIVLLLAIFGMPLLACGRASAQSNSPQTFTLEQFNAGARIFSRTCSPCHGAAMADPESAFDLRTFPHDQHSRFVNSVTNGKNNMPAWGAVLKPEQIESLWAYVASGGKAPAAEAETGIKIGGAVATPVVVSAAYFKSMPRTTVKVMNAHNDKTETYEGVSVEALLQRAGAPQGDQIRGPLLAAYVTVEGMDGYRVAFSLAELDSGFVDSGVIVADTLDGAPLGPKEGPFKLVVPHDKRPSRWVRMIKSITVVQTSSQ